MGVIGVFSQRTALRAAVLTLVVFCLAVASGSARPFKVAVATDVLTMDPDALNAGSTLMVLRQIYEPLVGRDAEFKKVPALAVAWHQQSPRVWRFILRPGVHFQDGSPFDADDVVFSLLRAKSGFSDFKLYTSGITDVRKIDPLTVDVLTAEPDPILPDKLAEVFLMDSGWAEQHGVTQPPQSATLDKSAFTALHANGTGPYKLMSRELEGKTELERNPEWWGDNRSGVDRAEFVPISSDGPRVAALLAGDVDLVVDVPPQLISRVADNPATKIAERTENRTIFLGMDVKHDSLIHGDITGRNPFKDRRVRRALYLAIDPDAIRKGLMQGHSVPAALLWAPSVFGYSKEDDTRAAPDPQRAKQLLTEAGYPSGFGVTLDCTTGRYVNDIEICQAVASQLARIGVRVRVNALPFSGWVAKLRAFDTSFYLMGWAVPTFDALFTLQAIVHSRGHGADGSNNFGGYSNPDVDTLIDQVKSEADPAQRLLLIHKAAQLEQDDVGYIPLHHQTIIWGMRKGIDASPPPENQLELKWIRTGARFQ
jgi:peptide/nickel transport system substrate-binding protein